MEMPDGDALTRRLDALYAERNDALSEGDLDRLYAVQASIVETIQQAQWAEAEAACSDVL